MKKSIDDITFVLLEREYEEYSNEESYSQRVVNYSELNENERESIAKHCELSYSKSSHEYEKSLRNALNNLNKNIIKKVLKEFGYLPAHVAEKINDVSVDVSNFYKKNCHGSFNPIDIKEYYTERAFKDDGPLYCRVTLSKNHPFEKAKRKYKKELDDKKQKAKERKKQREIEKAKKLLESEGRI